jgi:hypothetical protein
VNGEEGVLAGGIKAEDLRFWVVDQDFEVSQVLPDASGLLCNVVEPFGVGVELPLHYGRNKFLEVRFRNSELAVEFQIVKDERWIVRRLFIGSGTWAGRMWTLGMGNGDANQQAIHAG